MSYTKGEWYLELETGLILSHPEGQDIPEVIANVGREGVSTKPLKELLANAQLIASAPDLYEALKGIVESLKFNNIDECMGKEEFDVLTKALAKAEGV